MAEPAFHKFDPAVPAAARQLTPSPLPPPPPPAATPSPSWTGPPGGKGPGVVWRFGRPRCLADHGKGPEPFQGRVGQGQVESGRTIARLARHHYDRLLTVDVRDVPDAPFAMGPE